MPSIDSGPSHHLLTVPGLCCSGPDHWQSLWESGRRDCRRIEMPGWDDPNPAIWIAAIDRAIAAAPGPILLAAHSLGCHAVAGWALDRRSSSQGKVAGALLVAPPDVDAPGADPRIARFSATPREALPFAAALVASRNDPYASIDRSSAMARAWGARLVDVGTLGHINAESGLGVWAEGQRLAETLLSAAIEAECRPAPVSQ